MSLKGFHIVFITFSTLLALVGAWLCIRVNGLSGGSGYLIGAAICLGAAVALVIYGVWFYKKMKRLRLIT
jgi:CDP-diglyceride synthetase